MLKPILGINMGGLPVYQFMLAMGLLAAIIVLNIKMKRAGVSKNIKARVRKSFLIGAVFGAVAANLANWVTHPALMDDSIFDRITKGGFSFIFGMLTLFAVSAIILRLYKVDVGYFSDMLVPSVLILQCCARIGCSLTGCCYGVEMQIADFAFHFPARELEALFALAMFIVLLCCGTGKRMALYWFSYGLFRFAIDFGRGDDLGTLFGIEVLSPPQIVSIGLVVVGGAVLFMRPVLEGLWDTFRAKLKIKPYEPLPNTYMPERRRFVFLKVIAWILVVSIGCSCLFISANPFGIGVIDDIKYSVKDVFGFAFESRSQQIEIGQTSGAKLTDVSAKGTVTTVKKAQEIVEQTDSWFNANLALRQEKTLKNGNTLYVFDQTLDGTVILGKTKALVTDANGNALYVAGDAAEFSYTNQIIDQYQTQSLPFSEALAGLATVLEEMPCLFETERGLLRAKHLILGDGAGEPVIGVIVQQSDERIVCFTKPVRGVVSNEQRNTVDFALAYVKNALAGKNREGTEPDNLAKALLLAKDKADLTDAEFLTVLESAEEIASAVPNITPGLFGKILAQEIEQMLIHSGETEKKAEKRAQKVEAAWKSCDIALKDDETAVSVVAKSRKNSFKHKINYATDSDIFQLTTQEVKGISLSIETDAPIIAQIYNEQGLLITTVYTGKSETLELYPEDGAAFTVKISNQMPSDEKAQNFDYRISSSTFEIVEDPDKGLDRIVRSLEDAYNQSNLALFASIYAQDGKIPTLDEIIAVGVLPEMFEACGQVDCGGCGNCGDITGTNQVTDLAKSTIAAAMIPNWENVMGIENLKGSTLTLSVFHWIETPDGISVKAKMHIEMDNVVIYDGYTFFFVQTLEKTQEQVQADAEWQKLLNVITSNVRDYITVFNTDELYAAFGDTADSIKGESDLTSLYDLCEPYAAADGTLYLWRIDTQKAMQANHSADKVAAFQRYITRQNIGDIEFQIRRVQARASMHEGIAVGVGGGKMLYDAATSPWEFLAGEFCSTNEDTKALWDFFTLVTDPAGFFVDAAVDGFTDASRELAKECKEQLKLYEKELENQKALLVFYSN